jgi:hypothetical protein
MPPLAAIERFFERLFERPTARLFHTRLQPVQLQRRIERAMEGERLAASDRTLVPNRFVVHLHPSDLEAFEDMERSLAAELADAALVFAREHRYTLVDRPRVELVADEAVERSDIRVVARFADPISGRTGLVDAPADGAGDGVARGGAGEPVATMVFAVPQPAVPRARLRIHEPSGGTRVQGIGAGLTLGRAADNDVVLRDERVSRHHGRIAGRRGSLVYSDLGSTNGTEVNGQRVTDVVLGAGDRIRMGETTLEVEVDEAPS